MGCEFKIYARIDHCPIRMYKEYAQRQPSVSPESRFYLYPVKVPRTKFWFSNEPIGKNNIFAIAKNTAKACSILDKKTNHSARKTITKMLLHEKVSLTDCHSNNWPQEHPVFECVLKCVLCSVRNRFTYDLKAIQLNNNNLY